MLTIRNPEAERLAYELASQRGQPVDDIVLAALRAEWAKLAEPYKPVPRSIQDKQAAMARIRQIQKEVAALPVLDDRAPDDILGYNEIGLFDGDR